MRVTGIILIISLTTVPCAGMEISRVTGCAGGDVLKLRGDIEAGDYVKFRSYFADHRRIAGLDLDSSGGLLHEGFRIAALTRQKRLSTFVSKECDSACAFIFLLGRKRYVSKQAKIGVHAVGNDGGGEDRYTIRDTIQFARLSAKLGIPNSAIGKMVTTPPGKITFLDQTDLSALRVIVRDPFARTLSGDDGSRSCDKEREVPGESASKTITAPGDKTSLKASHRASKHSDSERPDILSVTTPRAR
jgi:hypothetical protein